jgi:hypothetical protein
MHMSKQGLEYFFLVVVGNSRALHSETMQYFDEWTGRAGAAHGHGQFLSKHA